MIEEQAGVEVVEQVHAQARIAFAHDDELAAGIELPVLAAALAARARLQRDVLPRHAEDLARGGQRFVEAAALHVLRDFRRRGVFLHVQERARPASAPIGRRFRRRRSRRRIRAGRRRRRGSNCTPSRSRHDLSLRRFLRRRLATICAPSDSACACSLRSRCGGAMGSPTISVHSIAPLNSWYFFAARSPVA